MACFFTAHDSRTGREPRPTHLDALRHEFYRRMELGTIGPTEAANVNTDRINSLLRVTL